MICYLIYYPERKDLPAWDPSSNCCLAPNGYETSTSLLFPCLTTLFYKTRHKVKWPIRNSKLRNSGKIQRVWVIYFPGLLCFGLGLMVLKPCSTVKQSCIISYWPWASFLTFPCLGLWLIKGFNIYNYFLYYI